MTIKREELCANKYLAVSSIISSDKNTRFFSELDERLIKKRFDNAYELSLTENIQHVSDYNLTSTSIRRIVNSFLKEATESTIRDKRNLYELVKLTNLQSVKLEKAISAEMHKKLIPILNNVSRETKLISFDFLVLRIVDNFILKNHNSTVRADYDKLKKTILAKIISFNYEEERKEKETTCLCWVDRILSAVVNYEISPENFIHLINKIFNLTARTIYTYWKALHSVNYLLLQQDFSMNKNLRQFKKDIVKLIDYHYNIIGTNIEDITNLTISTLAKKTLHKEDFYYLFDIMKLAAQKSVENKEYCLKLCNYIINQNSKQNIFYFRYIRKYFIELIYHLIKDDDSLEIKLEEIKILIVLFHIDTYFCFNRRDIFENIVQILKTINDGELKLTYTNFFKFCNILDYIMSENPDIKYPNIIDELSKTPKDKTKIKKHFQLLLGK